MLHPPLQDPSIYRYLPEDAPTLDALQRRYAFLENGTSPNGAERWLNWVAFCRGSHRAIGTFQATLSKVRTGAIACVVFPTFWRQGYARERTTFMLTHRFNSYSVPSLFAEVDTRNEGSVRLMESVEFTLNSTEKNADFFKGNSSDEYTHVILREDWHACMEVSQRD